MISDVLEQAAELSRTGQPFVLTTVVARKRPQSVRPGSTAIILPDGTMRGWVGGGCVRPAVLREARAALEDGQPRLVRLDPASSGDGEWEGVLDYPMTCQGEGAVEVYVEPVLPRPALLVLGRTPVAQALVRFGSALGFRVTAAEPAAREELFPDADAVLTDWIDAARRVGAHGFVVVATMGEDDEGALEAAAASDARYIGLVASRKKGESLLAYLRSRGVDAERAARIKFPAGLDIGAVGAEELALSIMAEIVQLRRAGAGAREQHEAGGGGAPAPARGGVTGPREAVDPVCGMIVEVGASRHTAEHGGRTFHFCCPRCRAAFEREPDRYAPAAAG